MTAFKALIAASAMLASLSSPAFAEPTPTSVLDVSALPSNPVWGGPATATPLAFDSENKPTVVVLHIPAGTVADTAHATHDGRVRFATVLSGTMFYADGDAVDPSAETTYPAGSMLLIWSGAMHWVSAREDDVVLLLTSVAPENLAPSVVAQLADAP